MNQSQEDWTGVAVIAESLLAIASPCQGQDAGSEAARYGLPIADETVWLHVTLDQFEGRFGATNGLRWDGEAWTGTDTNRLLIKSEGEAQNGRISDGQQEALYDTPISAYFDLQAGPRYDFDSGPGRARAALGVEGVSQYFFHVSATGYASDSGHYAAKLFGSC